MKHIKNDGGRAAAGYTGAASDCAARALAIAAELPYEDAYQLINEFSAQERPSKQRSGKSSARSGVYRVTFAKLMQFLGWTWVPTMAIGCGCTVHMREEELPKGRIIVRLSKHFAAVIDGVLHDTHDCSRGGGRCVYGYWRK